MRINRHAWIGALLLAALLANCGEQDAANNKPDAPPVQAALRPGEIVVEPSAKTYTAGNGQADTLAHARGLLDSDRVAPPAGYRIEVDEAFEQPSRLRFWLTPDENAEPDAESFDQAEKAVYDALAAAFEQDMHLALNQEIARLTAERDAVAQAVAAAQQELHAYRLGRRGLPNTDASRLEDARLNHALNSALGKQVELDKQIESLQRNLDRKRYPTLYRIR